MTTPRRSWLVYHPDPVLRFKALPIPAITDEVRAVAETMIELMHKFSGIGLAAPQVGISLRMFVANPHTDPGCDRVFVNPVLVEPSQVFDSRQEGCLSLPGLSRVVRRPRSITIEATDLNGNPIRLSSGGLAARVWQHECDHLDGVLIIDRCGGNQ